LAADRIQVVALALANLVLAAYMTGLIWFVGVVHYPLFARVGRADWAAYERAHRVRTTYVVAPPMLAQVPIGIALIAGPPVDADVVLAVTNLACVAVALGSTGLVFGPAHARLERRWTHGDHRLLVRGNWLRVAAWTAQTAVALALVGQAA
jgi:hypothetical protein